jgi:hypothetical protein
MAVLTLDVVYEMGARIMFRPFLLMTAVTCNGLRMNPPSFGFPVGFHIRDIPMATVAGVGSVNGLSEFSFADFGMATEAFGVIDTLKTIFASLDDKLLSLFGTFRKLGDP